jgi:hypothetical protein
MGASEAPLSLGIPSLLGRAFETYRARFALFLLVTVVAQLPTSLPVLLAGYGVSATLDSMRGTQLPAMQTGGEALEFLLRIGGDRLILFGFLLVAAAVLNVIGTVLSAGALAYLLTGEAADVAAVGPAYHEVFRRLGPLFGAILLAGFIICAVLALVGIILVFLAAVQYMLAPTEEAPSEQVQVAVWVVLFVLIFGGLGYAIFAIVRWALFVQAVVLENAGPATALRRSAALLRHHWWRTAVLLTVLAVGQSILGSLASTVVGRAVGGAADETAASLAGGLALTAVNLVYFPLAANALTLFYLALRAREKAGVR